jgi:hypothetical protein
VRLAVWRSNLPRRDKVGLALHTKSGLSLYCGRHRGCSHWLSGRLRKIHRKAESARSDVDAFSPRPHNLIRSSQALNLPSHNSIYSIHLLSLKCEPLEMFGQMMSESAVPPRKRRRPALSCVECRRRKIKCDRNVPCTQCTQSKSASCTYKDGYPGPNNGHTAKEPAPPALFSGHPAPANGHLGDCGLIVPFVSDVSNKDPNQPTESSART